MKLRVKADVKQVTRYLNKIQRKQVPFATALALTTTAKDAQAEEIKQMSTRMDRPTPFTLKGVTIIPAKKNRLIATVLVKRIQEEYLQHQITGGTVNHRGAGTGVPTKHKKLNKYGNIAGRRLGLVKGTKEFIATINGTTGVWKRTGGRRNRKLQLLIGFHRETSYRPIYPFQSIAYKTAKARFRRNFERAMTRALATAR